jgi:hypothetical protein
LLENEVVFPSSCYFSSAAREKGSYIEGRTVAACVKTFITSCSILVNMDPMPSKWYAGQLALNFKFITALLENKRSTNAADKLSGFKLM